MKRRTKKTFFWSLAGLLFSLSVFLVVFSGLSGQIRITDTAGIPLAADSVMNAVHTGDWNSLELLVAEDYTLEPMTGEEGSAERMIWEAYQKSLQWNCAGEFDIEGAKVMQKVSVTCLDIPALTGRMIEILPEIADDVAEEDLLAAAVETVLFEELPLLQRDITMTFVRKDGRWKLIPNNALLALLSGFTAA